MHVQHVLKKLLKKLAEDDPKNEPSALLCEETTHGLTKSLDEKKPKDLLHNVSASIACHSLLGAKEILLIEMKDAKIEEGVICVNRPCATKRRNKGFRFKIPL